jgi:hypothetical protein
VLGAIANGGLISMDDPDDAEPRRLIGMELRPGRTLPRVDPTEQRVLGLPLSWYRSPSVDFTALRHPIRWTKWRISAHRLGPYAPGFKESLDNSRQP